MFFYLNTKLLTQRIAVTDPQIAAILEAVYIRQLNMIWNRCFNSNFTKIVSWFW